MATPPPSVPPTIFSAARRSAIRRRMHKLQAKPDAPRYIVEDMVEDVEDRLGFLRHAPDTALVIGDWTGRLRRSLSAAGCTVTTADPLPLGDETSLNEERPYPFDDFDLIVSLGTLDTVNDLPGALIHIRNALAPRGLMLASFLGAGSLAHLRSAMLAADNDRPAARMHPMVDVRAGGQLMQRCGFANPVVDSRPLDVRFGSLKSLVADLRAQGLGNVLSSPSPALSRLAWERAKESFAQAGDEKGRVTERFQILTLSGWRR